MSYLDKLKPVTKETQGSITTTTPSSSGYLSKLQPVDETQVPEKKSTLRKIGDFFTGSTQKFGNTIGEAINSSNGSDAGADLYAKAVGEHSKAQNDLLNEIKKRKSAGQDTAHIEEILKQYNDKTPQVEDFTGDVINKTAGQVIGEGIGTGLEALSGGLLSSGKKALTSKVLSNAQKVKESARIGGTYGTIAGGSNAMQEEENTFGKTLKGAVVGGLTGTALGAGGGYVVGKIGQKIFPTKELLDSKLDDSIKNIFKDTVADVGKINESAFKARKGLELLTKESKDLSIPDIKAPLGSKTTKPFNMKNATPNELLSSVLEMDKKIVTNARTAVEKAKAQGLTIDTFEAESLINNAVKSGDIPKATGTRMLQQIKTAGNDPVKIHDWVQDVNAKYGKKYQRGTIDDTALGKLADDVAEVFRNKLDVVVDRKGYAEAFSNNQELKRMLVAIAKKANKNVNFGDIGTDAGLDLGISILTGNPAYMARTIGTGMFKGLLSNMRNQSGFRSLKKAADAASKLPTQTKLPLKEPKVSNSLKGLTPPKGRAKGVLARELSPTFEKAKSLNLMDRMVESNAFNKVKTSERKILDEYKKQYGKVVNPDDFRPFFKDVGYKGSNAAAVQEPVSYLGKKAFAEGLKNEGKYVTLFSGGSGVGKSTAVKQVLKKSKIPKDFAMVFDSNLSNYDSAIKKITQVEKAGKVPNIVFTYRDPLDALENGVVKRMIKNPKEMGRLVPTKVIAANHIDSWDIAKKLKEKGHIVHFVDNSLGKGKAKSISFEKMNEKIKYPTVAKLKEMFDNKIKELYDRGTITTEQYRGYTE